MQKVVPALVDAVTEACETVVEEAQAIVPVDTGELRESIHTASVELVGSTVQGNVEASAPHAGFVEFGTGARGAASPGAGPYPYTESWPGMPAQSYMRPALDTARPEIQQAFASRGFKVG
jgi:HK97 gp10 family phage protein